MSDEYEVGYGKPPKHSQFKPGQSGNPKGRSKKTRNFKTDLQEELNTPVTVTEGGHSMTISRQQALIKRTVEKALKGDLRVIQMLAHWVSIYLADDPENLPAFPLDDDDQAILERYGLARKTAENEDVDENSAGGSGNG